MTIPTNSALANILTRLENVSESDVVAPTEDLRNDKNFHKVGAATSHMRRLYTCASQIQNEHNELAVRTSALAKEIQQKASSESVGDNRTGTPLSSETAAIKEMVRELAEMDEKLNRLSRTAELLMMLFWLEMRTAHAQQLKNKRSFAISADWACGWCDHHPQTAVAGHIGIVILGESPYGDDDSAPPTMQ